LVLVPVIFGDDLDAADDVGVEVDQVFGRIQYSTMVRPPT